MRKKLLIRCLIGVAYSMVVLALFCVIFNRAEDGSVTLVSDELIALAGGPAAALSVSLLVFGLYGAVCMGGTLLYEIESWPLALATVLHYLLIAGGYALVGWLLRWFMSAQMFLLIEGIMLVGYFLVWFFVCQSYKAKVRELNDLKQKPGDKKQREEGEQKA